MYIEAIVRQGLSCQAKQARRLIKQGQVTVDGKQISKPTYNVDTSLMRVQVGKRLLAGYRHTYLILHKPKGYLSGRQLGYPSIYDLLPSRYQELKIVGRLDFMSEGLVLLTDNGKLNRLLLAPESHASKIYWVQTREAFSPQDPGQFARGIIIDRNQLLQPAQMALLGPHQALVKVTEGKNRQVRKMCLAIGKYVTRLKRVQLGPIKLPDSLVAGSYRLLSDTEARELVPYFNLETLRALD